MSGARPATKLESILGVERAAVCEAEIQERIHVDDTPELRKQLVKEILYRHINKANLAIDDIQRLIEKSEKCYCTRMKNNIVNVIWDAQRDDFAVNPNQRSR